MIDQKMIACSLSGELTSSPLNIASNQLNDILCYREQRHVGAQLTFHYDRKRIILERNEISESLAGKYVLCPAVSAELAGETISLRDITRVRDQRRRELNSILHHRARVVDSLLQLKKGITVRSSRAMRGQAT